jgi:hypothetical protein
MTFEFANICRLFDDHERYLEYSCALDNLVLENFDLSGATVQNLDIKGTVSRDGFGF